MSESDNTSLPLRAQILDVGKEITTGPREESYGDPYTTHKNIAQLWNAYLNTRGLARPIILGPDDVAMMMALVKIARAAGGTEYNEDNYVDGAVYLAIAGECRQKHTRF